MYFRSGMRWIPTYTVKLGSANSTDATISLQAELLNEMEDLEGVLPRMLGLGFLQSQAVGADRIAVDLFGHFIVT